MIWIKRMKLVLNKTSEIVFPRTQSKEHATQTDLQGTQIELHGT